MGREPRSHRALQIVFRGECLPGFEPQAVRRALAEALALDERRTARLFSGRRVVLRRAVSPESADELKSRFARMGAVVHAEEPLSRRLQPHGLRESSLRLGATLGLGVVGVVLVALVLGPGLQVLVGGEGRPVAAPPVPPAPEAAAPPSRGAAAQPPPTPLREEPAAAPARPGVPDQDMPADMAADARDDFRRHYAGGADHKAFAIATGGGHGWMNGAATEDDARERALEHCRRAARSPGAACRVVNADDVWEE